MNLNKLHLDKVKIPKNILKEMEDDTWECYDYEPFLISISNLMYKGAETLSYSLEFSPAEDEFSQLNKKMETHSYVADGYGWTNYLLDKLKKGKVSFSGEIENDADTESCVLVAFNESDFRVLLQKTSDYLRELLMVVKDAGKEIEKNEENMRTVTIRRFWDNDDEEDGISKPEIMFKRPRIDHRISEYLWHFLETNLLIQKKIFQMNSLRITLFIGPLKKAINSSMILSIIQKQRNIARH